MLLQWQDIFTKYTQVGICQCAVGFCLHHISEAEPVEFIIRSELLISGFHEYLVYFDHSSAFSLSSLGIRIDISLIMPLYDHFGHCVQNNVSGSNGSNQKELKQNKISEMDGV